MVVIPPTRVTLLTARSHPNSTDITTRGVHDHSGLGALTDKADPLYGNNDGRIISAPRVSQSSGVWSFKSQPGSEVRPSHCQDYLQSSKSTPYADSKSTWKAPFSDFAPTLSFIQAKWTMVDINDHAYNHHLPS